MAKAREEEWTVDKKLAYEEEIAKLKKEVEKLSKRNKLLVKRLKKSQEESKSLATELDIADVMAEQIAVKQVNTPNMCPDCGAPLETPIILPNGKSYYLCSDFTVCKYRLTID